LFRRRKEQNHLAVGREKIVVVVFLEDERYAFGPEVGLERCEA